jgi:hypothetical protein
MTRPDHDVNSVDEIVVDRDPGVLEAVIHDIELHSDVLFTWDYERGRTALVRLRNYDDSPLAAWGDREWRASTGQEMFQTMLFSKIVPNVRMLGPLDAGDGWLRLKFTEMGVIQFEDWTDNSEEYADLDAVAADRALTPRAQVGGT